MVQCVIIRYRHASADTQFQRVRLRLARTIADHTAALGLSQEEAAHRAGLAWRHYQKLEASEVNDTLKTLVKLSKGLKSDIRGLF